MLHAYEQGGVAAIQRPKDGVFSQPIRWTVLGAPRTLKVEFYGSRRLFTHLTQSAADFEGSAKP